MKIICDKCGYAWETKSDHVFVSCPSCLAKIKVRDINEQEEMKADLIKKYDKEKKQ